MIVLMAGLPGTGKSTLARALAARVGGSVIGKDEIRHALFSGGDLEYSTEQDDFVMDVMLQAAAWILRKDPGRIVILDGRTFSRRYQIERVLKLATDLQQPSRILECVCSEETARRRIESQASTGEHVAGNRTFDLYLDVKARFEPITFQNTIIDTDRPLEECVNQAHAAIR
jgi:adenylylsulfate kinase